MDFNTLFERRMSDFTRFASSSHQLDESIAETINMASPVKVEQSNMERCAALTQKLCVGLNMVVFALQASSSGLLLGSLFSSRISGAFAQTVLNISLQSKGLGSIANTMVSSVASMIQQQQAGISAQQAQNKIQKILGIHEDLREVSKQQQQLESSQLRSIVGCLSQFRLLTAAILRAHR